ncbi:MAG: glutathione S-transferase N-terminal domain-containing protein, partial [Lentisphaeraceae bacterium]|nr:glutathione S-transferase N-terminal domain-containing protein [Lentisphaeraceae bacterium]
MKLYNHPVPPNPRRVRIALAEKGILNEVELVDIDILNGEQNQSAFLEKNPYGGLPVLELNDGTIISESVAITRYFEALSPEVALLGNDAKEIALIDMWMRRIESGVLNTIAT